MLLRPELTDANNLEPLGDPVIHVEFLLYILTSSLGFSFLQPSKPFTNHLSSIYF